MTSIIVDHIATLFVALSMVGFLADIDSVGNAADEDVGDGGESLLKLIAVVDGDHECSGCLQTLHQAHIFKTDQFNEAMQGAKIWNLEKSTAAKRYDGFLAYHTTSV